MSELTRCNRCTLDRIMRAHGAANVEVRQAPPGSPLRGWVEVFVNDKRVASFMSLPDHCMC